MNWIEVIQNNQNLKQSIIEDLTRRRLDDLERMASYANNERQLFQLQGRVGVYLDLILEITAKDRENARRE